MPKREPTASVLSSRSLQPLHGIYLDVLEKVQNAEFLLPNGGESGVAESQGPLPLSVLRPKVVELLPEHMSENEPSTCFETHCRPFPNQMTVTTPSYARAAHFFWV